MNPLYAGGCGIDPAPGLVFDEDTWNLRRRIVGDFSNAAPHEAHGNAFISGAWKYLGIPLKPEYENGQYCVTEDPKWNDKIAERRDAVASAYSTPLTMPYSIVTGSDTIETIEATISSRYAVEIFKIAVEIIQDATGIFTGESVQTSTDKDSAMWAGASKSIANNICPRAWIFVQPTA